MERSTTREGEPPGTPTPPADPGTAAPEHRLALRFTGSGSEYFRIWIVNLLLTLLTLGLYHPWAKARKLRYFHGNTLVDGHPLGFHGDAKKMLRGYLLVGALLVLNSLAAEVSTIARLAAFLVLALLWPALLKSSMQFRMANTSWRGLRFRFTGSMAGAYRAWLPLFVPALLVIGGLVGVTDENQPPYWYGVLWIVVLLGTPLVLPWLWWNLKKYQHGHYALGGWQTELRATLRSFYGVFLKTYGIAVLLLVAAALIALGATMAMGMRPGFAGAQMGYVLLLAVIVLYIGLLVVVVFVRPYFVSRMQNLVWSRTGNRSMRFRSKLGFVPLLGLTVKNWLLVALTLGLYWPFAAVAMARLRLEAVSLVSRIDPATLVAQARAAEGDAAGDAAGDLFGMDIGL